MTRRELLQLAASAPALAFSARFAEGRQSGVDAAAFTRAPWSATPADGTRAPAAAQLTRTWNNERCQSAIVNSGAAPVALKEVSFSLSRASRLRELWSDEDLGMKSGTVTITMPPRSGKVLIGSV